MLTCPYCSNSLVKEELGHFCHGCGFSIPFVFRGKRLTEATLTELTTRGKSSVSEWTRHDSGTSLMGHLELTKEKTVRFIPKILEGVLCPLCHTTVLETPKSWQCETGDVVLWKSVASRTITPSEARTILRYRKSDTLEGFVSKETGKRFSAELKLLDSGEVVFDFT